MNQELIQRYLSGDVTSQESVEVMLWIEASQENGAEFTAYRKLFDATIWHSETPLAVQATTSKQVENKPYRLSTPAWLSIAATILVAFVSFSALYHSSVIENADILCAQTIVAPHGQYVETILSDGTIVTLNPNSTLTFANDENANIRAVFLDGEGYFEVTKNPDKPFVVKTTNREITVLGTIFNVFAYSNTNYFETTLLEGAVKVEDMESGKTINLNPSERLTIHDDDLHVGHVDVSTDYLWRKGIYSFQNQPLSTLLLRLEKTYDVKINIEKESLKNVRYTGKFKQNLGIEYIINVLQQIHPFDYTYSEPKSLITIY